MMLRQLNALRIVGPAVLVALLILLCPARVPAQSPASLVITEFMASNSNVIADGDGDFSDWVEIYNPTTATISLTNCYLTDSASNLTKWRFPAESNTSVTAGGYAIVWASGKGTAAVPYVDSQGRVHTSWKLDAAGENVQLVDTNGTSVISSFIGYPNQITDKSYGLGSNSAIGFLNTPTPGAANTAASILGFVEDTTFSLKRGFYTGPISVSISTPTPGATIKYTLDSSTPSETSGTVYSGPINISSTTVLRAMAYKTGYFSTNVDTQTYIYVASTIAQPVARPSSAWPLPAAGSPTVQAIDYGMDTDITSHTTYGPLMNSALTSIPSISLVTELPNLFNATTGIYLNPGGEDEPWERPAHAELIYPSGAEGFHVNCGVRIRGGVSTAKQNPKHSFRIIMKDQYGESKIKFPIFGPTGAQDFDKLDFRTAQNFSWNMSSPANATWLDDPFSRDTMRDMGQPYTRGFFFHLYLDGVYWGLYQTEERPARHFFESYLGGSDDDYDVLKSDEDTSDMYAVDGTITMYNNFWTQVSAGVGTIAQYYALQGKNADGTTNTSLTRYLDRDNLIDYMLLVFYTGGTDMPLGPPGNVSKPRNLVVGGNRVNPDGFKYISHDNEWSLLRQYGVSYNRVNVTLGLTAGNQNYFNPWWLHTRLRTNSEYVMDFADRVHLHFFNGGALTPAKCVARYQTRIDEITTAIIAESARWGDWLSPTTPRTRDGDWLPAVTWVRDSFLNASPQTRTAVVLGQLQTAGLYPTVVAPVFSQHGGSVSNGTNITMTAPAGTIYYTTDGSDPRLIGGGVNGTALSGASGVTNSITTSRTIKSRARVGTTWSALNQAAFTTSGGGSGVGDWVLY